MVEYAGLRSGFYVKVFVVLPSERTGAARSQSRECKAYDMMLKPFCSVTIAEQVNISEWVKKTEGQTWLLKQHLTCTHMLVTNFAVTKCFCSVDADGAGEMSCTSDLLNKMLAICCLLSLIAPRVLASHILIKVTCLTFCNAGLTSFVQPVASGICCRVGQW